MSAKWTSNSESGILRKSDHKRKEKKEELFVFGYSCKLFREDEKAQHIDQGKHLIPWMGDETLKIDRYDARGALHELASLEAPVGGYDWRVELTRTERDVEQLCDEERYRALHTDEDEEEMYKEEELKRLHAAGYGQVGFNYEIPAEPSPPASTTEIDEPFLPPPKLKELLPADVVLPDGLKLNAIIEKTAKFIASQGAQMEILLRAKQADNAQFQFLNKDSALHPYYLALTALIKSGKWPEKVEEVVVEEKHYESEEYLHPSLGITIIESAPSIPSIVYKPSADCDYTMLISKIKGVPPPEDRYETPLAPGELPPPGTEILRLPPPAEISKPPVMYTHGVPMETSSQTYANAYNQYAAYYQEYAVSPAQMAPKVAEIKQPTVATNTPPQATIAPSKSTGLSLMKHYDSDSSTDDSDSEESSEDNGPPLLIPSNEAQVIINKMATYVARNGDEFADIVRAKNDPRFTFLDPNHEYYPYYKRLMEKTRAGVNRVDKSKEERKMSKAESKASKKSIAPVSFSIKKLKEPEPVLPKPALPYESSSDDESDKQTDDKSKDIPQDATPIVQKVFQIPTTQIPQIVYRIETQEPVFVKPNIEKPVLIEKPLLKPQEPPLETVQEEKYVMISDQSYKDVMENKQSNDKKMLSPPKVLRVEVESTRDKKVKKKSSRKRDHRSKSESRDRKRSKRSPMKNSEVSKKKSKGKESRNANKDEIENEIISIEENCEELIDLTGDLSDSRGEGDTEVDRAKQRERRLRAAEFLRRVGVDNNSLASAMVETLHSIQKKKLEEEERRRRHEKRRHRDRHGSSNDDIDRDRSHRKSKRRKNKSPNNKFDENGSDYESRKKKHKKDKKRQSSKSKRRKATEEDEREDSPPQQLNIDLSNTLKELRSSPTRALGLDSVEDNSSTCNKDNGASSSEEESEKKRRKKKRKEDREYSEGEWASSDSEDGSYSTRSKGSE